ncbi:LPP20 family lipoprotein [Thiomicrorhabdus sp.]|uniref:LPP20 family lipoprotein n=1 Tax=Thiomicrorhabdus sp. TaxID=2039724 RepID=UPI002AA64535|nr:LPP20 family lipoprotein [Thiomicrorhabdus sp.]
MKKRSFLIAGLASVAVLSGCNEIKSDSPSAAPVQAQQAAPVQVVPQHQPEKKAELLKITGIGYGAESTYAAYTPGQRRLMAIRASKLDAYRALAEQLYGIKIDSNTSVSTLTAKNDSFRARVNAVVRGARVVSVTPMADQNYETVLEVYVDKKFFEEAFIYSSSKTQAVEPEAAYKISSY